MAPKRRSQVACGFSLSTRDHWFGIPVEVKEGSDKEVLLIDG
jgi:hypothetical protein